MSEKFQYTYSAKQREEVKAIREKYLPPQEDKLALLRRLDEQATRKGTLVSMTVGVVSALVMGTGMSCVMVWGGAWFVPGILIGLAGMAGVACAWPLYSRITKKEREKAAPQILKLTEELLK